MWRLWPCLLGPLVRLARAESFRQELLQLSSDRLNVWYADKSNVLPPKESDGVSFRLSVEDKSCGGDGVPLTFMEFDIGARPVDVFNVLVDSTKQSSWDPHTASQVLLCDREDLQVKGYAALFSAQPLPSREVYQWQAASANFSSEEFWVTFSSISDDELRQLKPVEPGAVLMETCLATYKITRKADGSSHLLGSVQSNGHTYPLTARFVASSTWTTVVDFAQELRKQADLQAQQKWPLNRTVLPDWMLTEQSCAAEVSNLARRNGLLARANAEFRGREPGSEPKRFKLENGEELTLSTNRDVPCAGAKVPLWNGDFAIPSAWPAEVFNVLVAKGREASWNHLRKRVNLTGISKGERGVHEEFELGGQYRFAPRELWEWQVARHDIVNDSYVVALSSLEENPSSPFANEDVAAAECLTAFEIRPEGEGVVVRLVMHMNPHAPKIGSLVWNVFWNRDFQGSIVSFANSLINEVQRVAGESMEERSRDFDVEALALLAPLPPRRNSSVTIAQILTEHARQPHNHSVFATLVAPWLRLFGSLNLPQALAAASSNLPQLSNEVFELLRLLASEVTAAHLVVPHWPARDGIELQRHGEILAAVQLLVLESIAAADCESGPLPDINKDKAAKGFKFAVLISVVLVFLTTLGCMIASCVWRYKRRRRQRQAEIAASVLLSQACVSTCSHRDLQPAVDSGSQTDAKRTNSSGSASGTIASGSSRSDVVPTGISRPVR